MMRRAWMPLLLIGLFGCKKEGPAGAEGEAPKTGEPAAKAEAPAAKAGTPEAQAAAAMAAAAKAAAAAAGAAGDKEDEGGGGKPTNPAEALAKLGSALAQGAGGAKPLGEVVNWRALAALVPAKLGGQEAQGETEGSTAGMGQMKVSKARRRYGKGETHLTLEIVDTSLVPMLRAGFALAAQMNEDSSSGTKKGVTIDGSPGMAEWHASDKRGKLAVLIGGRFLVEVTQQPIASADALVALAKEVDLKKLAGLKAEAK
ncbi:MAG: hypothetical protein IT371_10740 [Deltaproteobacteria bacterium]|nr:hypothetical protein [Deltaproteobacteria bacterium]